MNAELLWDPDTRFVAELVDGLFQVNLHMVIVADPLTPVDTERTFSVSCIPDRGKARRCAGEWRLVQATPILPWRQHVSIYLPAGWTDIEIVEDGVPLRTYSLLVDPRTRYQLSDGADLSLYNRGTCDPVPNVKRMDVYVCDEIRPAWSNGFAIRNHGYRRDGTAKLEVFGANVVLSPGDEVSCVREDGLNPVCDGQVHQVPGGRYSKFLAELPVGATTITVAREGRVVTRAELWVSERVIGVPKQVLDCFTDTTYEDAGVKPNSSVGCGGWHNTYMTKWDADRPVRVKLIGPNQWTSFFVEYLTELQPLFNLEFEWITNEEDYDLEAVVGITHEQSFELGIACSAEPITAGCASVGIAEGRAEKHITIYNIYPELFSSGNLPESEFSLQRIRSTILHEAVHAIAGMGHRIDTGTFMLSRTSEFIRGQTTLRGLNPMDLELIKLHAHPVVRNGMDFADVERFVVTAEEMLKTPGAKDQGPSDQDLSAFHAWSIVDSAFRRLRTATTAQYVISTELAGCDQRVTDAVYQVGNIRKSEVLTGWARLSTADTELYMSRDPTDDQVELWEALGTGWAMSDADLETTGWLPDLSDPYRLLLELILYADWSQVAIINRGEGIVRIETYIPTTNRNAPFIRVDIETESSVVSGFAAHWGTEGTECDGYKITATDGKFGEPFTWPEMIQTQSSLLDSCDATGLPMNPRAVRIPGQFNRECKSNENHIKSYQFTTNQWSLLRIDLNTPHEVSAVIRGLTGGEVLVNRSTDVWRIEGLEGYGGRASGGSSWVFDYLQGGAYLWHHDWLPPGEYQIDIVAPPQQFPGRYTMLVDTQSTPGDPTDLRFKAVATSHTRTCALTTDGTPLCWGRPTDSSEDPTIPVGPFDSIFGGNHFCALDPDGSPQCWDFKEAGEHICFDTTTNQHCHLLAHMHVSSSNEGLLDRSSIAIPGNYYDQTPPTGDKFKRLAPGRDHTCGLRADGSLSCWGKGEWFDNQPPTGGPYASIASGDGSTCGLKVDGTMICWGLWSYDSSLPPSDVKLNDLGFSLHLPIGQLRTCGLDTSGHAQCFGRAKFRIPESRGGVICPEVAPHHRETCERVNPPPESQFVALSSDGPDCGIRADGSVECWHQWGIVGSPPVTETFTAVSSGKYHVCGLRANGTIACWGDNGYGQSTPPNGTYLGQFR